MLLNQLAAGNYDAVILALGMALNESQAQRPRYLRLQEQRAYLAHRENWWMRPKSACTRAPAQFERAEP